MAKRGFAPSVKHRKSIHRIHSNLKYWPMVYCEHCDKVLAFVLEPVIKRVRGSERFLKRTDKKISSNHFQSCKCVKLKGYEIDFFSYQNGQQILCPKCSMPVDLSILFPSSTKPTWRTVNDFKNISR